MDAKLFGLNINNSQVVNNKNIQLKWYVRMKKN